MAVPVLLSMNVDLTLVSICLFPFILGFAVAFFRKIQHLFLLSDEAEGEMTTVLQENLTGIRVVRAFARQDFECEKFAVKNAAFRDHTHRLIRFLGAYWATSDFLCVGQNFLLLVVGTWWMVDGRLSVGTLFAFQLLVNFVLWPVRHLGRVLTDTGKAMVALKRIREILEVAEEVDASDASPDPERLEGRIEVADLTFGFDPARPVLSHVSFTIEPGETLALVGPPGSGKSVLVQLLLRLYDYDHGSIRIDGRELATLSRDFVRRRVGVVLQEPFLFSKTLAANIRMGHGDAHWDRIVESSQDAGIHATIEGFDQGYETRIGERGVTLSGGQRQRVAIARALVKDPDLLVLDDALSAVDTHMEARILGALRRRRGRRTTIVIAHRLSTVTHAERILVLDRGHVVQSGTHAELAERDGPYRQLWNIQGSLEREIREDLEGAEKGATP
jgi:ATP-binding cassette subfamily B protein